MASNGDLASGVLVSSMWWYAATVLYPAQALRRAGINVAGNVIGDLPVDVPDPGLGPYFSARHVQPVLLEQPTDHDYLVDEFSRIADVYDAYVRPFSRPIFEEALSAIAGYLRPSSRVLDAGCGPGRELLAVARTVPDGEVVGVDLAEGMVEVAHRSARAHGVDHTAFYQADAGDLPADFAGKFDLIYSCLAHHHLPEPDQAAAAAFRALRRGGVYCVIDPGPAWYNAISAPIAKWADPGWIGFHTPDKFRALFRVAGFRRTAWIPILPGFGVAVGQKDVVNSVPKRPRSRQ